MMKKQAQTGKKIFANHISEKELTSRIYFKTHKWSLLHGKITKQSNWRMSKGMKRHFTEED